MIPNQMRNLSAVLIASGALLLAFASGAHAAGEPGSRVSARACEETRQSAWFERQRQLTDGDTDPSRVLPAPRECRRVQADNGSEPGKQEQLAATSEATTGAETVRK